MYRYIHVYKKELVVIVGHRKQGEKKCFVSRIVIRPQESTIRPCEMVKKTTTIVVDVCVGESLTDNVKRKQDAQNVWTKCLGSKYADVEFLVMLLVSLLQGSLEKNMVMMPLMTRIKNLLTWDVRSGS